MAIIKCPECGHQISEKATICPICGVEIDGKITRCVHCGEVYFKADGLCPNCHRPYHSSTISLIDKADDDNLTENTSSPETNEDIKPEKFEEKETAPLVETEANPADTSSEENSIIEEQEKENEIEDNLPEDDFPPTAIHQEDDTDDTKNEFLIEAPTEQTYIDTDGEAEDTETETESTSNGGTNKHNYIPLVVSLAITAVIASICLYFYNESKKEREIQAFNVAMESGDTEAMRDFLLNYTDASDEHKTAINEAIAKISKQEQDLSLCMANHDKNALLRFVKDYPDSPHKSKILSIVDTLDWEDATKTNTKKAYDKYIAEHADGAFIKEAKDKVSVKKVETTQEDDAMVRSLFREFFLSVNGNDAARLTPNLSDQVSSFMSTPNASKDDIVSWMKRQHGEGVSNVIWKLNGDYKIQKREQGGTKDYTIDFTAKKTVVHTDGRATSEHYKINSNVNGNGKISSMEMTKYTPQPNETAPASTSNKTTSTSTTNNKSTTPNKSTNTSNPTSTKSSSTSSSTSTTKPATTSKPANTSNPTSTSKPANTNKPATTSKPATTNKPTTNNNTTSTSKPTTSNKSTSTSKPATTNKPATTSKPTSPNK